MRAAESMTARAHRHLSSFGLTMRKRDRQDRRFFIVHLTDEGNKLIRKIFPPHAAVISNEFSVLTASEQKTLGALCKKLGLKNKN
jgi:MarR family 2-MHQ and catechol resistance regulon transcriptional repressor